jgi:hypothetical protein
MCSDKEKKPIALPIGRLAFVHLYERCEACNAPSDDLLDGLCGLCEREKAE